MKGADGCADGTEVCSVSYGMSTAATYGNGITVADSEDYERTLSREEAKQLARIMGSNNNNPAVLAYGEDDDSDGDGNRFYLVALSTADNSTVVGAQMRSGFAEQVTHHPIPIRPGQSLEYTLAIQTWATYGGPAEAKLYAQPSARDSGLDVRIEPAHRSIPERSEASKTLDHFSALFQGRNV